MRKSTIIIIVLTVISAILFGIAMKDSFNRAQRTEETVKEIANTQTQITQQKENIVQKENKYTPVKEDMLRFLNAMYSTNELSMLKKFQLVKPFLIGNALQQLEPKGDQGMPSGDEETKKEKINYTQKLKQAQVYYAPSEDGMVANAVVFFTVSSSLNGASNDANYLLHAALQYDTTKKQWLISDVIDNQLVTDALEASYFHP
ncbi:hypothetical protein [Listeria booriae]|uniref:Uncharacterized protein n=1 Tax=Listeria booriae TaxID=1552123 RepID=A0A7X0WGP6_9LIST|nr:hypothetical protein [Listeria booriae]MBC1228777.1 hypothetical protein [Listeria booriae]MBC1318434.1 hypothetical protein [Listeria booriae]MBC1333451.1 hypothetical protein [Listeria booriae]MBC2373618.1 hypothetical protein [Listeria booriae]MBC2388757.1 hypothetical protein [Listeria booriae]